VVSAGDPVLVIMELMENGDLKSFLRKRRPVSIILFSPGKKKQYLGFLFLCENLGRVGRVFVFVNVFNAHAWE
jgi:hypothetical protein